MIVDGVGKGEWTVATGHFLRYSLGVIVFMMRLIPPYD
jgi:hypothetical protein